VDEAQGRRLVAHDEDGFRSEVPMGLVGPLQEIGLPALRRVPDDGIGLRRLHLV
jgi:hypothetical protein